MRVSLEQQGFNLCAAIACASIKQTIESEEIPDHGRLLLFAAAGGQLWKLLLDDLNANDPETGAASVAATGKRKRPQWQAADTHVVDDFSSKRVLRAAAEFLSSYRCQLLYPGDTKILLPALGEYLGWSHQSPLGLGIHPQFGLWFAYRVLCWTDAPIDVNSDIDSQSSPCASCQDKPCVRVCPAGAVSANSSFDLKSCAEFRLQENSICADRCLARLACPVGTSYQHSQEQHGYHQMRSLAGLANWLRSDAGK